MADDPEGPSAVDFFLSMIVHYFIPILKTWPSLRAVGLTLRAGSRAKI
jgi:hypothetical protein